MKNREAAAFFCLEFIWFTLQGDAGSDPCTPMASNADYDSYALLLISALTQLDFVVRI
jgi:hypothetical protein